MVLAIWSVQWMWLGCSLYTLQGYDIVVGMCSVQSWDGTQRAQCELTVTEGFVVAALELMKCQDNALETYDVIIGMQCIQSIDTVLLFYTA